MKLKRISLWATASVLAFGGPVLLAPVAQAIQAEEQDQQGAEVLTRGPVHEAFAETVSYNPTPGIVVNKEPPAPIEELPPEQQLEGNNVSWIPGYWAWDDDRSDFMWISGIWRNLPPGRQWVPGYWNQASDGYQWTSGYWADSDTSEVSYLPEPPQSLESGPSAPAETADDSWVPGNWSWYESRYVWTGGYWQRPQQNWIWCPAHYNWTPRGYLFVDGYWDYSVARRGVLFAPVYFSHDYYSRPGFSYSPLTVISLAVFADHLFLRPNYGHYYFGDYYDPRYRSRYYAPYAYNSGRVGYDPFFAHQRWENRSDRNWVRSREQQFDYFRDNAKARPPQTFAAFRAMAPETGKNGKNFAIASSLGQYAKNAGGGQRFQPLSAERREKIVAQEKQIQTFGQERRKQEASAKGGGGPPSKGTTEKMKFTPSPVVGKSVEKLSKTDAPPKRPEARTVNPKGTPGNETKVDPNTGHKGLPNGVEPDSRGKKGERVTDPNTIPEGHEKNNNPKVDPRLDPRVNPTPEHRADPRIVPGQNEKKTVPETDRPERRVTPKGDNQNPEGNGRKLEPRGAPLNPEKPDKAEKIEKAERKVVPERAVEPKTAPERVQPKGEPERKVERPVERAAPQPVPERKVERPVERTAPNPAPNNPAPARGGNPNGRGRDKDKDN